MSMSNQQNRRRGDRAIARALKFARENTALRRELKETRRAAYIEGSSAMMASVAAALDDDILNVWLAQRMMACRVRRAPFHLPQATAAMVRAEISAHLKKCGIKSVRVEDIAL